MTRKGWNYLIAIIVSIGCVCIVGALGLIASGDSLATPTPAPLLPQVDLSTMIAQTSSAAQAQTLAAYTPVLVSTLVPALTIESTATIFIFELQTNVAQPTESVFSTNTPFILATQPPPSGGDVCSCGGDTLNCSDFSSHSSAQACHDYCISQGSGDIHSLDSNGDGDACESLP